MVFRTDRPRSAAAAAAKEGRRSLPGSDGSFSVTLPAGWQQCEGLNSQALLQAGDLQNHRYLVVLMQRADELPGALTLSDYCVAQLQQCTDKVVEGRMYGEPQPLLESRLPAYAGEMAAQVGEVEIQYLIASLQSHDCFYTLFLWCERGDFERQRAAFMAIVAGFRVVDRGKGRGDISTPVTEAADNALEKV